MSLLLGGEYARMWLKDRDEFREKTYEKPKKVIYNDIEWWLKMHKTDRCFCAIWEGKGFAPKISEVTDNA